MIRPRVALVHPYWDFWEHSVSYDLRADREALSERVRATLDVAWTGLELADAVLVLQTMATPPAWTLPDLGSVPVVVWAAHRAERVPESFDHGGITAEGATVGTPMLTSVLVREGRPFELVLGRIDDDATLTRVRDALVVAAAASRLARARIGRVGRPLEGYACVDTDDTLLHARTGIELVPIEPSEVRELYLAVPGARVRAVEDETRARYDVELEGSGLERSLRAACAIEDLVSRHRLDAGAMNCHVPEIRFGDDIGVTPCLALGRSTTAGVPWTCVGDVLTAVAMLVCKLLGGAAQYHELEELDYATGEFVVASSGEFDLALAGGSRPRLIENGWFASDTHRGACACFSAPAGPATLVGFAQIGDSYRFVAAEGEFTGRAFDDTGTANAAFRFARGPEAWVDWCRAGVNHHSSATRGLIGEQVAAVARFLRTDAVIV